MPSGEAGDSGWHSRNALSCLSITVKVFKIEAAHREVLDGVALAAVPLVGADEGEEERDCCAHQHDAHSHSRIVEILCMRRVLLSAQEW